MTYKKEIGINSKKFTLENIKELIEIISKEFNDEDYKRFTIEFYKDGEMNGNDVTILDDKYLETKIISEIYIYYHSKINENRITVHLRQKTGTVTSSSINIENINKEKYESIIQRITGKLQEIEKQNIVQRIYKKLGFASLLIFVAMPSLLYFILFLPLAILIILLIIYLFAIFLVIFGPLFYNVEFLFGVDNKNTKIKRILKNLFFIILPAILAVVGIISLLSKLYNYVIYRS